MASEFLLAFRKLIELADNDPTDLPSRADANPLLQRACDELNDAFFHLRLKEKRSPERFSPSIPSNEIRARREFEERWLAPVAATDSIARIVDQISGSEPRENGTDRIASAKNLGIYLWQKFDGMIDYMRNVANQPEIYDDLSDVAQDALRVWDDFGYATGFNLAAVLARLELVPFVLIPSDVSRYHGTAETFSMLQRLADAQRAFIFGCYLASAALQRSILEDLLHRNYPARGRNLPERINSIETALPWGLRTSELHAINLLANDVLHVDREAGTARPDLVGKLVCGLEALRRLIEGAPQVEQ